MTDTTVKAPAKPAAKPAKAERKKPVRTAPVQKDYPNKLAWLKAMTEHEERETAATNKAKVERLDKRIASAKAVVTEATAKVAALEAERAALVPAEELVDGMTEAEHLAAEGKA